MVARSPLELSRRLPTVTGNRTVGYSGAQLVVLNGRGVGVMVVGGCAEDCTILPSYWSSGSLAWISLPSNAATSSSMSPMP
jgi:hypothetical protein